MTPTSRTPEGEPHNCPICGRPFNLEPSLPPGDVPCPHCGSLAWTKHRAFDERLPWITPGLEVRITEGPFESFEGAVEEVVEDTGLIGVLIPIFGRETRVEVPRSSLAKAT